MFLFERQGKIIVNLCHENVYCYLKKEMFLPQLFESAAGDKTLVFKYLYLLGVKYSSGNTISTRFFIRARSKRQLG